MLPFAEGSTFYFRVLTMDTIASGHTKGAVGEGLNLLPQPPSPSHWQSTSCIPTGEAMGEKSGGTGRTFGIWRLIQPPLPLPPRALLVKINQTCPCSCDENLHTIPHIPLGHNASQVHLDRALGHIQSLGHLRIGHAQGKVAQDI